MIPRYFRNSLNTLAEMKEREAARREPQRPAELPIPGAHSGLLRRSGAGGEVRPAPRPTPPQMTDSPAVKRFCVYLFLFGFPQGLF